MDIQQNKALEAMISTIDGQINDLAILSKQLVNQYWVLWNERGEKDSSEWGKLGVRAAYVESKKSLSICWYQRLLVKHKDAFHVSQNYIEKGSRKDAYTERKIIKVARDWELELFREFEPEFTKIRKRAKQLGRIKKNLKQLIRIIDNDALSEEVPNVEFA